MNELEARKLRVEIPWAPVSNEPGQGKTGSWRFMRPILRKEIAPCSDGCPAGIRIRDYIKLAGEGKFKEAWELLKEDNPLPAITGRVCYHPCESVCNRGRFDEPIAVHSIERFIGDYGLGLTMPPINVAPKKEKIAIVGSGPAGLTCGYYLARKGYHVTIFEALPVSGGMLNVGIPKYRLPKKVLEAEINSIEQLGVEIRTNTAIGKDLTIDDLFCQGYQIVFVATGAHNGQRLGILGQDSQGVIQGVSFLRDLSLGHKVKVGRKVAVIGGGNVAIDAARCALRLGSKEVFILYRRSREEMPASEEEISSAEDEGIKIEYLTAPTEIFTCDGKMAGIRCNRMKLGKPDASGRREPIPIEGSEFDFYTDTVILAIGQVPDLSFVSGSGIKITERGTIVVDPLNLSTTRDRIYAGGDVISGPARVADAIKDGKRAAQAIDAALTGQELVEERGKVVEYEDLNMNYFSPEQRQEELRLSLEKRVTSFGEINLGLGEATVSEAKRCFHCGACSLCEICQQFCPEGIIFEGEIGEIEIDYDYCKGCGICANECPRGACGMVRET